MANHDADVAAKEVQAGLRAALDPDPERARQKYALLRRKLVRFFEWSGATSPDARADETLMTAAWRLTDGAPVQNVPAACLAIARAVQQKPTQEHEAATPGSDTALLTPAPEQIGDLEGLLFAFDAGIDALPEDSRDVILTYFAGEHPQAIEARRTLAQRLNLPLNQLRLRAHRTRAQLEQSFEGPASSPGEPK